MSARKGRKSVAQTPAPKSDRIKGSKTNKPGSAASKASAKSIQLSEKVVKTLKDKADKYNETHSSKVSVNTLKAVFRRGAGAYSTSHRPTITGGAPNSRNAWSFARVNKFLLKKGGTKVKAAYVQDDDLMAKGGVITWEDYQKTQFDEDENRYLPSDYFEEFEIKEVDKSDYPNLLKNINGLEYRKWRYGGIGVFDGNKKVAFADNGSIQVAKKYQKRGIGLELVTLLKELNPNHKFGNMTPQGRNLMRSYYDKKIANNMEKGGKVFNDSELLAKWKKGESIGFTGESHLKAKGLIPRADGTKRKSEKYMEKGGLIAPNGKESNLTLEQYKLVRTPEFKAWFGDWENEPQNASKVVDENGEPLVVYHGTYAKEKFNIFDFSKADLGFHFGTYEQAKNRSFTKFAIKEHKQFVEPFFVNIRQLFLIEDAMEFEYPQSYIGDLVEKRILTKGEVSENSLRGLETKKSNQVVRNILVEKYKKLGFKYHNKLEGEGYSYIVCEPNQIKLADGTNKNFDMNNPDIRYKQGGYMENGGELIKYKTIASFDDNEVFIYDGKLGYSDILKLTNKLPKNINQIQVNLKESSVLNTLTEWSQKEVKKTFNSDFKAGFPIIYSVVENGEMNLKKAYGELKNGKNVIFDVDYLTWEEGEIEMAKGGKIRYEDGGNIKNNNMELTKSLTISDIDNKYPEVSHEFINKQVHDGIKTEMEHTKDPEVAKKIALDHLNESIHYYEELEKMEKRLEMRDVDEHYEQIKHKYAEGGEVKRTPSTDSSVWTAQFNVGDKVRIRVDMSSSNNIEKVFEIEKVEYAPPFVRTENPSGKLYILSEHGGSWEGKDLESTETKTMKNAEESTFDEIFQFTTPTKVKSKLSYLQQVLVRTSAFKNYFGDWELAANRFLADGKENFDKHYKEVSKVLEPSTLEPRVVYHGTMTDNEFFSFDVTREKGVGRPYAYFAYNKEYAQHFTQVRQREAEDAKPFLYEVFLNVRHPFVAQGHDYVDKSMDAEDWLRTITGTIVYDRYKTIQRDDITKAVENTIKNQVGRYVKSVYENGAKDKFWKLMAADSKKDFKFFLLAYDFDGVFYSEEFGRDYDVNNPEQFTLAITVFDAHQIKLADARNTQFDPFSADIRYEEGGKTTENLDENNLKPENMNKLEAMHQMMEKGGKVKGDNQLSNDAKDGGYFVGKSHAEGGIKVKNVDTNQIMEVEGNEVIINKRSVADSKKREFEGQMLTNREILSKINEGGGGVKFADGGEVKYNCGCSKKSYNFGGEILEESIIVKRMNELVDPIMESKKYLYNLMNNIYG